MPSSENLTMIVIDSSAVVHYLTDTTSLGQAARAFFRQNQHALIAPPLFLAETESTINLKRLQREITQKEMMVAREVLELMDIEIIHLTQTHPTARKIADSLRLPRIYDATFAALALLYDVDYYTADLAFYHAAHGKYPFVKSL